MSGLDGLMALRPRGVAELDERTPQLSVGASAEPEVDFGAAFSQAMRGVVDLQEEASDKAMALARGEPVHMHDVLVAMGKSEVAFDLMLEVRNKLLAAWESLSRSVA